jgi:hypothetical protein
MAPPTTLRGAATIVALLSSWCGPLTSQDEPTIRVAFRAGAATSGKAAIARLCDEVLPRRAEWPTGLAHTAALSLEFSPAGLRITPTEVPLPPHTLAAGSVQFGQNPDVLFALADDGIEDWFVPASFTPPASYAHLLRLLQADEVDQPRTFDMAVLAGHLAGPRIDGDPHAELATLAALCGDLTFTAWRTDRYLRVRGRSEGGLLLPAMLIARLSGDRNAPLAALPLRAFSARDGDRGEAIRQLLRGEEAVATRTLRSLLLADDELRLSAIDTLIRRHATDELPRIVAAARPGMPLATQAAIDALQELWIDASPEARQRTKEALARSSAPDLRRIDPADLPNHGTPAPSLPLETSDSRARLLLLLFVAAAGIYSFWLRERSRAHGSIA